LSALKPQGVPALITGFRKLNINKSEVKMKGRLKSSCLIVAAIMLVTVTSPIFAQSETDPVADPVPTEEPSSFVDHPIVKLLAGYFANLFAAPVVLDPVTGLPIPPDPLIPVILPEEAVAALHTEQGLGFGEITKLLQLTVQMQESCTAQGLNCGVTLDSLVAEYKAGAGMGALFKKYGKPIYMGVGQVRKAANPKFKTNNGHSKGNK
jgi:hypothetical protein